jgi:hypothetical protein
MWHVLEGRLHRKIPRSFNRCTDRTQSPFMVIRITEREEF